MRVAVLGLGEAGSRLAGDLAECGVHVSGYDVRRVGGPSGVQVVGSTAEAVDDADLVLSLTASEGSLAAAEAADPHLSPGAIYADLNASGPSHKKAVAARVTRGRFADVAILAPIARAGIRTPVMACGPGAEAYLELLGAYGADVDLVDGDPGTATARKLLRSIFMKSLATTVIEALNAGTAAGCAAWVRAQIEGELGPNGSALVDRLVRGTFQHARRRRHEMADTSDYLHELGCHSEMTEACRQWLHAIEAGERTLLT